MSLFDFLHKDPDRPISMADILEVESLIVVDENPFAPCEQELLDRPAERVFPVLAEGEEE